MPRALITFPTKLGDSYVQFQIRQTKLVPSYIQSKSGKITKLQKPLTSFLHLVPEDTISVT